MASVRHENDKSIGNVHTYFCVRRNRSMLLLDLFFYVCWFKMLCDNRRKGIDPENDKIWRCEHFYGNGKVLDVRYS